MKIKEVIKLGTIIGLNVLVLFSCGLNKKEENVKENFKEFKNEKLESIDLKSDDEYIKNREITILIDPGHTKNISNGKEKVSPDGDETKLKETVGATGANTKKAEHDIVVDVALNLEEELLEKGYNVVLTKRKAEDSLTNIERARMGNEIKADLVVKLHCDSSNSRSARGASMLIPKSKGYITKEIEEKSKEYGEIIFNTYLEETKLKSRGLIYREDLTGFNWSEVPVVLLEMGYISNEEDEAYIVNRENQKNIAKSISDGIEKINFK